MVSATEGMGGGGDPSCSGIAPTTAGPSSWCRWRRSFPRRSRCHRRFFPKRYPGPKRQRQHQHQNQPQPQKLWSGTRCPRAWSTAFRFRDRTIHCPEFRIPSRCFRSLPCRNTFPFPRSPRLFPTQQQQTQQRLRQHGRYPIVSGGPHWSWNSICAGPWKCASTSPRSGALLGSSFRGASIRWSWRRWRPRFSRLSTGPRKKGWQQQDQQQQQQQQQQ
mmetsp:Transcript_14111/g.39475  ORF Transcript_14111/g.39475 Transcript_14111/m.39475 type:complete len:218 (-) Transcript_14111:1058-1711(-)